MAKKDGGSSSSSCKGIGSPLARSQHESPGSGSFSGAVEGGKSFIKPAALSEGRKKAWQDAKGFVSTVSSSTVSGSQTCNTEHHDDWLNRRTFAALKLEIDDSPTVSCLRHHINGSVPPSVGSVLSATEDHNHISSSSGQYHVEDRYKKVEEASVSSFEYRQIAPQVKDSSGDSLWQELKVVGSCDSSRGSLMNSVVHPNRTLASAKASSSFHNMPGNLDRPSSKLSFSNHYKPNMVASSSLTTSDSDASGDHNPLANRFSKLSNRLKGGGSSVDASDGSGTADVNGMKTLIERQRQSYIRRLKREIQWLEKVEKLLLEAQGRKRDSAFTKRAVEIALQRVGSQTNEESCHACRDTKAGAVAALLEESASVYNSPLFVRCDFLKRFQGNEKVKPVHDAKGSQSLPKDLFKTNKSYHSAVEIKGAESEASKFGNENCEQGNAHNAQTEIPTTSLCQSEKSVHYSENIENQTVTLSYQQLTKGEATLEHGQSTGRTASRTFKPTPVSVTSNKVELTSTPYSCQVCRHRCPCLMKLSGIPFDSVRSHVPANSGARAGQYQNQSCPAWLRSSIKPPSFHDGTRDNEHDEERIFVSIPILSSPTVSESKKISAAQIKRHRSSPQKNVNHRKTMYETPAEKSKVAKTQRLSKSGIAWYVPVNDHKPWLRRRGCGDGSMTEVEAIPGQTNMDDALSSSVEELTLQDAFRHFKATFISRSQARVRTVKVAARQRRHRVQARAIALTRNRRFMATMPSEFIDQLHRPCKRSFSHQEMRNQTERIYRTLPEFQQQIDYKRRKEVYRTNRLMAEIYKQKVLQKTLAGKVSYAITEKLL